MLSLHSLQTALVDTTSKELSLENTRDMTSEGIVDVPGMVEDLDKQKGRVEDQLMPLRRFARQFRDIDLAEQLLRISN